MRQRIRLGSPLDVCRVGGGGAVCRELSALPFQFLSSQLSAGDADNEFNRT
jgi:hypothetical protein